MSKLDDAVEKSQAHLKDSGIKVDAVLLRAVAKGLGPSIYGADSKWVALSDPKEVERVKKNFLIKKLGLKDTPKLDEGIAAAKANYKKPRKYRAAFYYLLTKQFRKSKVYA